MCGRFTLAPPEPTLRELIGPADWSVPYTPRWNVAPGQDVLTVVEEADDERRVVAARWGFRGAGRDAPIVNARLETAATNGLFRRAFAESRCIVPADSFYEWKGKGGQPWRVTLRRGAPFGLAAIRAEDGTLAVLTMEAASSLAPIHHRMPAMLASPSDWRAWLGGEDATPGGGLFVEDDDAVRAHPVSRRVNSVLNDDPECAAEAAPEPTQTSLF